MNSLQVRDFLRKCNLLEYYDRFIAEGYDQLQSLLDVTEADLIAMDVKRGHRRRLQREIVTAKGVPPNIPLPLCIQQGSGLEDSSEHLIGNVIHTPPLNHNVPPKILYVNGSPNSNVSTMGSTQSRNRSTRDDDPPDPPDNVSTKRKYKRHPKRDKSAPIKPLSAYVMFAHKVREEFSGQNISFPDMAKIVGDRWKNIRPEEKESYEIEAAKKKEEYQAEMSVYKTTESWKKYQEYLKEFKEKYELNSRDPNKRKRIKMEPSPESDNTRSGYSSTRSTSVGYDNGNSGNTSSGSSNGNGNSNSDGGNNTPTKPYSNHGYPNYIPPYTHFNPTVYGFPGNNSGQNTGSSIITPPPSINTSNGVSSTLADLYANDSNAGDDQSQPENGSRSGNGSSSSGRGSSSSRSAERQSFEDSSDSTSSSNTPPAVSMEIDDNPDHQQSQQNQSQNQQDNVQQDDAKNTK